MLKSWLKLVVIWLSVFTLLGLVYLLQVPGYLRNWPLFWGVSALIVLALSYTLSNLEFEGAFLFSIVGFLIMGFVAYFLIPPAGYLSHDIQISLSYSVGAVAIANIVSHFYKKRLNKK